jgi:hypothetical protein
MFGLFALGTEKIQCISIINVTLIRYGFGFTTYNYVTARARSENTVFSGGAEQKVELLKNNLAGTQTAAH